MKRSNVFFIKKYGFIIIKLKVYCKDIDELLLRVVQARQVDPSSNDPLVGLDKGQGFLKVDSY